MKSCRERSGHQVAKTIGGGPGHGIGYPEEGSESTEQQQESPQRVGGDPVYSIGDAHRPAPWMHDGGPHHPCHPVITTPGDIQVGVLVLEKQPLDLYPG